VLVEEVAESISDISVWTATLTFPIVVWSWFRFRSFPLATLGGKSSLQPPSDPLSYDAPLEINFRNQFVFQSISIPLFEAHRTPDYGNFPSSLSKTALKLGKLPQFSRNSYNKQELLYERQKSTRLGFMNGKHPSGIVWMGLSNFAQLSYVFITVIFGGIMRDSVRSFHTVSRKHVKNLL